jgi:hypothetical protein
MKNEPPPLHDSDKADAVQREGRGTLQKNGVPNDWEEIPSIRDLYDTFRQESDRGIALVGAAYLDEGLAVLLESFLIQGKKDVQEVLRRGQFAPLGTFSARTKAAYCLGLISKNEYEDLNSIRGIRNDFAHQRTDMFFTHTSLEQKCRQLLLWKHFEFWLNEWSPREIFQFTVALLLSSLGLRTLQAEKQRRKVPGDRVLREIVR